MKTLSALPGLPFPDEQPRYVPRQGVVDYLARVCGAGPDRASLRRGSGGDRARRRRLADVDAIGAELHIEGRRRHHRREQHPNVPQVEGGSAFVGTILHSRDYRSAAPFAGRRVLVVGMGNTGAEIALDLAEHGVAVDLSVRSPVNIVLRDVLGRPTQKTSIALARLPTRLGDALARFLAGVTVGDLGRLGLRRSQISPLRELREHGRTPVIDVGTVARIRAGEIGVRPGIRRLHAEGARVRRRQRRPVRCDRSRDGLPGRRGRALSGESQCRSTRTGCRRELAGDGPLAGIYFVGFDTRQPGGLLRTIAAQAIAVAERICATPLPARAA